MVLMRNRPSLELVDHGGDQSSPPRLVRRAQPATGVAVEVLVEEDVIAEVRILPHLLRGAESGRPPSGPGTKIRRRRRDSSLATSPSDSNFPEPVGHSTLKPGP